jgi:hypothetical protein
VRHEQADPLRGALHIVEHDGRGGLRIEHRPYVIMKEDAYVSMGVVRG